MVKNNKKNNIPRRNYIIALLLIIGVGIVTLYTFQIYNLHEKEKLSKSFLMSSKTIQYEIKKLEEINSVLSEAPNDYFLYIGYTGDKEMYNLEVNLKKVINDYDLNERFYFLNITDIKENNNYLKEINQALNIDEKIVTVPTILFFEDNQLAADGIIVREDGNLLQAGDFAKFLDQYEIHGN